MPKKTKFKDFIMLFREVNKSYAMRAASGGCRKAIDRIVEEHFAHGGVENGNLEVQFEDFVRHGITSHDSVMPALREGCALGLIILTQPGRAGNAEHRASHKWAVAFIKDWVTGQYYGTKWKRFRSLAEAKAAARKARAQKDTKAVEWGLRRAEARRKLIHFPLPETGSETTPGNRERKPKQVA